MGMIIAIGSLLCDLFERQATWSQETFGPDGIRGPIGPLKHLKKEADEAIKAHTEKRDKPDLLEEHADCLLLLLDATRRAGFAMTELLVAAEKKQAKNMARIWPKWDEWVFEKPGFIDSEDCMGNREAYWRVFANRVFTNRGPEMVAGFGTTPKQALEDCKRKINECPVEHKP